MTVKPFVFKGYQGLGELFRDGRTRRKPPLPVSGNPRPQQRSFPAFDQIRSRLTEQRLRQGKPEKEEPCQINHRSEEHTSELQSLMRISYAVFCLKKKKPTK